MKLEAYQSGMAALIQGGVAEAGDWPYLRDLACDGRLALVRDIVCFWRARQVAAFCVFSVALLKRIGRFDQAIERFVAEVAFSPQLEEAGAQFLRFLASDSDPIVAAMARSETALHATRTNLDLELVVEWPCHPIAIFEAILDTGAAVGPLAGGSSRPCRMRISRSLPAGFLVEEPEAEEREG
jgi:hypothetical protein